MSINHTSALTTVVSYPDRGTGGSNSYRGNCSPRLIEDLIAHFNPQEICDYMCGSNTTGDAASSMGIASHTYDLHSGFDLLHCDIPERPQFVFWHPPYWDIIKYSDVMYKAVDVEHGAFSAIWGNNLEADMAILEKVFVSLPFYASAHYERLFF